MINHTMRIKINMGSGVYFKKGWISVDKYLDEEKMLSKEDFYKNAVVEKGYKYVKADICELPFKDNFADLIECHQVIEHLPMRKVIDALKELYRVLKKGGKLIITTPNFNALALDWLQFALDRNFDYAKFIDIAEPIYGNQHGEGEGEFHRCPMTPDFLNFCLSVAGFKDGILKSFPRGMRIQKMGELSPAMPDKVYRNEVLYAEVKK